MAKKKAAAKRAQPRRNFPTNNLKDSLTVAQKIADERGGANR